MSSKANFLSSPIWPTVVAIGNNLPKEYWWAHKGPTNKSFKNVYKLQELVFRLDSLFHYYIKLLVCAQHSEDNCISTVTGLLRMLENINSNEGLQKRYPGMHKWWFDECQWAKKETMGDFVIRCTETVCEELCSEDNVAAKIVRVLNKYSKTTLELFVLLAVSQNHVLEDVNAMGIVTPHEAGTYVCRNLMQNIKFMACEVEGDNNDSSSEEELWL